MKNIITLRDRTTQEPVYPITSSSAVYDSNGKSIDNLIANQNNKISSIEGLLESAMIGTHAGSNLDHLGTANSETIEKVLTGNQTCRYKLVWRQESRYVSWGILDIYSTSRDTILQRISTTCKLSDDRLTFYPDQPRDFLQDYYRICKIKVGSNGGNFEAGSWSPWVEIGSSLGEANNDYEPVIKNARMEITTNGDNFLAYGESTVVTCKVFSDWTDVTSKIRTWRVIRDTGDFATDNAWLQKEKVKNFNGTLVISFTADDNDIYVKDSETKAVFTFYASSELLENTTVIGELEI